MKRSTVILFALTFANTVFSFPSYGSLARLSNDEIEAIIPTLKIRAPETPPGPLNDTSAKLVNDAAHQWQPLRPGDMRGPCPGLNALASHGWLPRTGVATPAQIINAVQEGLNMGNDLAVFIAYAAILVDGNVLTNLLSIGGNSPLTGPPPPKPAIGGGLNTHLVLEGDVSMTRQDAYFGDNHSFNETLFDEMSDFSNRFGAGKYNLSVAAEFRWARIQSSLKTNPTFNFEFPRYFTAYADTVFPAVFFVDGRISDGQVSQQVMRGFFQENRMPDGFFRSNQSWGFNQVADLAINHVYAAHPIQPGKNTGFGNYTVDLTSQPISDVCRLYTKFVNETVKSLYPSPKGVLRDALNTNLNYMYSSLKAAGCTQVFPFGK